MKTKIYAVEIKEICEMGRYHVYVEVTYHSMRKRKYHMGTGTTLYWDGWKNFKYLHPKTVENFLNDPRTIQTSETKYDTVRYTWYFQS